MLYPLTEGLYRYSPWYIRAYHSIMEEVRKKRLVMREIPDTDQLTTPVQPDDVLLVLGMSKDWFNCVVQNAHSIGLPVLSLLKNGIIPGNIPYSSVAMEDTDAIRIAVDYLKSVGKHKLALYGGYPNDISDINFALLFQQMAEKSETDIYAEQ